MNTASLQLLNDLTTRFPLAALKAKELIAHRKVHSVRETKNKALIITSHRVIRLTKHQGQVIAVQAVGGDTHVLVSGAFPEYVNITTP